MNLIEETRAAVFERALLFEVVLGSREVRDGYESGIDLGTRKHAPWC
jgi:hypothetical protein